MSTLRGFEQNDVSSDTGEIVVLPKDFRNFGPGVREDIVTLRMRLKTHTAQDPYLGGQMLATVRWHDGNAVQEWNLALATTEDLTDPLNPVKNYSEQGQEIWMDATRDLTIQVSPLVAGGSVDVLLDYVEL